jgi:hypothetical protein
LIPTEEIENINKGWLTLNIIWAAMLISVFIYLFVGLYTEDKISIPMEKNIFDILRNTLYIVSFVTLIATKYIRKLVLSGKGLSNVKKVYQQSNQNIQHPALARYTTAMIIALAMSESIGIYGLILFFLGKNQLDLYLLILISAAAMLYYRPKKEEVISMAKELKEPRTVV